ncbi:MAG: CPBP family intramembrane glutamic endopeptidase, partial [Candidatus Hadarchaeum sp.]|uniref:CPBP family intramembrane glutamic endopeptidase n=1 Tax=Candidatus Hadarchaeum sp. TaxID=2883567 RepID=UPI003D149F20
IVILPIFEEWIFRGILLEEISLRTKSRVLGVLASALAFGFFHLSNPGTYPALAIPLTLGGALLGACYLVNGLAGSILSHILYNFLILVV